MECPKRRKPRQSKAAAGADSLKSRNPHTRAYPAHKAATRQELGSAGRLVGGIRRTAPYTVSPRTSRSSSAHANSAIPMNPLTEKNARFSRDRSCGRTTRCSYTKATATITMPIQ